MHLGGVRVHHGYVVDMIRERGKLLFKGGPLLVCGSIGRCIPLISYRKKEKLKKEPA